MDILKKSWFIAVLGLLLTVGTNFVLMKVFWKEIFPEKKGSALVVTRTEPEAFEWGFASEYIQQLESELKDRLMALDAREAQLANYEGRLQADRAEIEEIKTQVEMMREDLLTGIVKLEASETENLKRLAKTYATLTPEATVSIFRELDDATVVKILFFMKSDTVGSILQEMATGNGGVAEQVRRAAKISDLLRLFTDNSKANPDQT